MKSTLVTSPLFARLSTPAVMKRIGGNRKHYQQSTNADQKSIKTVFSIAMCRQCWDKWQLKTLFLKIILTMFLDGIGVFHCHLHGVVLMAMKSETITNKTSLCLTPFILIVSP